MDNKEFIENDVFNDDFIESGTETSNPTASKKRKKKPSKTRKKMARKTKVIIGISALLSVAGTVGGVYAYKKLTPYSFDYEKSGVKVYDEFLSMVTSYNRDELSSIMDISYLAKEFEYANGNKLREDFIGLICGNISFNYDMVDRVNLLGEVIIDKATGAAQRETSDMVDTESVYVNHIDYRAIANRMIEEKDKIFNLFKSKGYSVKDYDYNNEITDLMIEYINSIEELPFTESKIDIPKNISLGVTSDAELDKLLFSSEDFHYMCDIFTRMATGVGVADLFPEEYKKEVENPEYKKFMKKLKKVKKADKDGKKGTWTCVKRKDSNGKEYDFYTIIEGKGKKKSKVEQPPKSVIKDLGADINFVNGSGVTYTWIGAYYCANEVEGGVVEPQRGDGTFERPAGIGTTVITKAVNPDGSTTDIKVALKGYWVGQDAINYAVKFSDKNRGFDSSSVISLICWEIEVTNLSDKEATIRSDLGLCDANAGVYSRTGSMYGFKDSVKLKSGESAVIQDWATSLDIDKKFCVWGKSFKREYNPVWFDILAFKKD